MKVKESHLAILKTLYGAGADNVVRGTAGKAIERMEESEQKEFSAFQQLVGELFIELMEELDKGLEDLADACPHEPDPRKWDLSDWVTFELAIFGHKYEELYRTYAKQEENKHLVWKEIEARLADR